MLIPQARERVIAICHMRGRAESEPSEHSIDLLALPTCGTRDKRSSRHQVETISAVISE